MAMMNAKGMNGFPQWMIRRSSGGRLQYPVLNGELAATVHTREVDASILRFSDFREERVALDGRWEITVGLWFETLLQHQESSRLPYEWTKMTTLGTDYTFNMGNGLHVILEHFATAAPQPMPSDGMKMRIFRRFPLSYPYGLFDNFSAIGYYSWEQEQYWQYLSWQRTYNTWSMNISLFSYHGIRGRNFGCPTNNARFRLWRTGDVDFLSLRSLLEENSVIGVNTVVPERKREPQMNTDEHGYTKRTIKFPHHFSDQYSVTSHQATYWTLNTDH